MKCLFGCPKDRNKYIYKQVNGINYRICLGCGKVTFEKKESVWYDVPDDVAKKIKKI